MIPRQYLEILIATVALVAAIYIGSHIVALSSPELGIVGALVFTILWAFTAGDYWWIPVLAGATIWGVFWVGFKVYPLEVSVALSVIGLAPLILARHDQIFQRQRRPLPFIFYLTALYVAIRILIDVIPARGARGNLGRILFDAFWPFIFGWLFHFYGKTSVARAALGVAFLFLLIRAAAAVAGYFINSPLYIPGINYVLSFSTRDSLTAMRFVAFMLALVSLILYHAGRSILSKGFFLLVAGFAGALLVMGASRFMTLMLLILPVCFFAWTRSWIFFVLSGLVGVGSIGFINLYPESLKELPPVAGRALSGLIFQQNETEIQRAADSSNLWHSDLRKEGYHRWTETPVTFLFGYGIRPSPDLYDTKVFSVDRATLVSIAANVASYESGLWVLLAVLGSVGFVLYALLFIALWKQTFPYLFRKPIGTLWEGFLFWGCYSSVLWFVVSNFMGSFPSLELVMMIIAADIVQDGRLEREEPAPAIPHRSPQPQYVS